LISSKGNTQKIIYYNDPFSDSSDLDVFHDTQPYGIENFSQEKGIGWQGENKMLLAFASGENVGEASKENFSFSLVNLGDPVIQLKHIPKKFVTSNLEKSFDPTLGQVISHDPDVVAYQIFDYNNDQKPDILLAKTDGYIELLENKDIQ